MGEPCSGIKKCIFLQKGQCFFSKRRTGIKIVHDVGYQKSCMESVCVWKVRIKSIHIHQPTGCFLVCSVHASLSQNTNIHLSHCTQTRISVAAHKHTELHTELHSPTTLTTHSHTELHTELHSPTILELHTVTLNYTLYTLLPYVNYTQSHWTTHSILSYYTWTAHSPTTWTTYSHTAVKKHSTVRHRRLQIKGKKTIRLKIRTSD